MNLKRVSILLGKELLQGPKNFILIWIIVAPVLISLIVSLVFGTLFTDKPKFGVMDEGSSKLVTSAQELDSIITKTYDSVSEIKQAVESGSVDLGIVLPQDLDERIMQGSQVKVTAYVWGQSLAKERIVLRATFANLARGLAGQEALVEIESATLGGEGSIPWNDRLLPFIVLMAVFIGGVFLPAISLIDEKQKKTLRALVITPTSVGDVFAAKGIGGVIISLAMGVVILTLNQAFTANPLLLVLVLTLGAVMASELGLICGALIKDATTLFAIWKVGGIVLFAPALVYMFPQIPEWVGKIMPTYYLVQPIIVISQQSGGWYDISTNVLILVGLDVLFLGMVVFTSRKAKRLIA